MIRTLKLIFTVNFLISILVYGGYIAVCLRRGADIDDQLGFASHHGRGGPLWVLVAFLEIQLLVVYFIQRRSDDLITLRHRIGYLLFGAVVLLMGGGQPFIAYVGCSDIAFGLFGSNDT